MNKKLKIHWQHPVIDYLSNLVNFGADFRFWPRAALYFIKFASFEPLRILERIVYGNRIAAYKFKQDPIFILGYYRSGTTHLQEVMLQDKRFGYMNFYQCFFSSAFLVSEKFLRPIFDGIVSLVRFKHPAHKIPFHFKLPGEEDVALVSSGYRLASNWGQVFPRSFKKFFSNTVFFESASKGDQLDFQIEMLDLIKRVSIANGGKQLLLKSPPQTARIQQILEIFPRAKFIFIHRNLYDVYKSNQKLWQSFKGQCLQNFDQDLADESILWSLKRSLECYDRDRRQLGSDQLFEIRYDDFLSDPISCLASIYKHLDLGDFDAVVGDFADYLNLKHGTNVDRYVFTKNDIQKINHHWGHWLRRWNYEEPHSVS